MSSLQISFETDNAAFVDYPDEISKILREIGQAIEQHGITEGPCQDRNGNTVGQWSTGA